MKIRAMAFIFAVLVALAGCARTQMDEPSERSEPPRPPDSNHIAVGIVTDFDSLDPHISTATATQEVMFNIFHGLINTSTEGAVIPELCESYKVSDDLLTYTFTLREDVKFHDGTNMTAADVAYSYRRLMGGTDDQTTPLRQEMFEWIKSIETQGDTTVIFHLNKPNAGFIYNCMFAVIPEGSGPSQATEPVGTGPFSFVSYTAGIGIEMKRFDDYYGEMPKVETAEFRIFRDANTGQLAAQTGEIHLMPGVVGSNITYDKAKLKMLSVPSNTVQLLAFNHAFKPFQERGVRMAIDSAINKADIIKAVSPAAQQISTGMCPVMSLYYNKYTENKSWYDPEGAKDYIKPLGYHEGNPLRFTIRVAGEYKANVDAATIIQQNLADVGIEVTLDIIEWNTWLTEVYTDRNYEATVIGFTGKIDPAPILQRYQTGYSRNFMNYSNSYLDGLLEKAASTADQNKRISYYNDAQLAIAEDKPGVFLMDPSNNILMDIRLEGYRTYPMNYIDLRGIYFAG